MRNVFNDMKRCYVFTRDWCVLNETSSSALVPGNSPVDRRVPTDARSDQMGGEEDDEDD